MLAKSKLNSSETLMSQTLADLDISHEEFKTIVNEKEKFDRMKENIGNIKSRDELTENSRMIRKNSGMHRLKKRIFSSFVYIRWLTSAEKTWEKNGV